MTVIIVPEMPISRVRASSAVPWNSSGSNGASGPMSIELQDRTQSQRDHHGSERHQPQGAPQVVRRTGSPHGVPLPFRLENGTA